MTIGLPFSSGNDANRRNAVSMVRSWPPIPMRTLPSIKTGVVPFAWNERKSIGVPTTVSFGIVLSSAKSLDGRSNDRSASPRSSRARRFPADGMMRMMTRLILGIGPFFQSSLRT